MRTGNPAINESVFSDVTFGGRSAAEGQVERSGTMTVQGSMAKTAILLLAVLVSASFTYTKAAAEGAAVMPWMWGGLIGGFVTALIIIFKPNMAPTLAVPYALLEGLFLGAVSAFYGASVGEVGGFGGGIVFQAVTLTFATALGMFGLYAFRVIRVTDKLRSIVIAATGGIALYYVIAIVAGMFGVTVPFIHDGGTMGIAFSVFVVGLAAFNLLLDFDIIERGVKAGAPKSMEWYGAFSLMVTLVWLYIEMLRLLAKLNSDE